MRHETPRQKKKIGFVMHEYKTGALKSGHGGAKVRDPKQAIAIALREAGVPRARAAARAGSKRSPSPG
jgi:hypothetical protein